MSWFAESDSATSSASVLDLVTIVWRIDSVQIGPDVPMVMHDPVWDLPSTCTPYDASMYANGCMPAVPGVSLLLQSVI